MNNNFTFAISNNCNIPEIKTLVRKVKTKSFCKIYKNNLMNYMDRLTSANCDNNRIILSMLQNAFGCNIGKQIFDKLSENDILKIKKNLIGNY